MRGKIVVAMAGAAVLAASCSSSPDTSTADADTKKSAEPSATPVLPVAAAKEPIVLAFGGDTHFEGVLRQRLATPKTAFGPIAATLRKADLAMVNLETAVTTGGNPAPGKEYHFRAPASAFTALKAAGVDVTSMANNHGMDFMESGLRDSLAAIKKTGFPTVGIGRNAAEAFRPWQTTIKGNRVAVIGATQVLDDHLIPAWTATAGKGGLASAKDVPALLKAVRAARKNNDLVVVHLHWGEEGSTCPIPRQPELAKQLINAGADVIVGGHAHRVQAGGYLDGRYVHYGLGNFVFYSYAGDSAQSGVLLLKVEGRKVTKAVWKPARISGGLPILMKGQAAKNELARYNGLRRCAGLTAKP